MTLLYGASSTNPTELKSFLGLMNYYCQLIPNLSTIINTLNLLLAFDTPRAGTNAFQEAFKKLKEKLVDLPALANYDPNRPYGWLLMHHNMVWELSCRTSLMMEMKDQFAYASCSLSASEQNYWKFHDRKRSSGNCLRY